jgi:hypothetical protein
MSLSAPTNALFVVVNQTTVPDDLVFIKFLGAQINATATAQTFGDNQPLATGDETPSRSYSLAQMAATVPAAPTFDDPMPIFQINDYSGGRIYFSLGVPLNSTTIPAAQNPSDLDFATVYGFVEPSVFPDSSLGQTNIDASYVDFVGIPITIAIKNRADGSLVTSIPNNPLSSPAGSTMFDALTQDPQVPSFAQVSAKTSATSSAGASVKVGGTARILSPSLFDPSLISGATGYHDWTSLIGDLTSSDAGLSVASYTVPSGDPLGGVLFGFGGGGASNIGSMWTERQNYSLTATAMSDLNPGGANARIPQLAGVAGIKMSGLADAVGDFDVYLTGADLNAQTGIYGANPPYVIDWLGDPSGPTAYPEAQIMNDLGGRIVGDLLAGFNFGWAANSVVVSAHATATGTSANLAGTVFDVSSGSLANATIGRLTTGQLFYLLSLQPTTADLAEWFGAQIQPEQPTFYNNYASDFQSLTNAYNMAFTDRLQGNSNPDMFFSPSDTTYVEITLLPGAYLVDISAG